jgi:hypothetical protein
MLVDYNLYTPQSGGFELAESLPPLPPPEAEPQYCRFLELSEVSVNDQWIEIYNNSSLSITPENLTDCHLLVQKGETLETNDYGMLLSGLAGFDPYEYAVVNITTVDSLSLPKSKNRVIMIYDDADTYSFDMVYSTHKAETSWAYFADGWILTYNVTLGSENIYQQFQTCEVGKHINVATGNCVKDPEPPAECAEGQYRNPATNRCKKLDSDKALAECADGQFRNPLTNRCKKIASDDELSPCAEGWERNPETNRCRKTPIGSEAAYSIDPVSNVSQDRAWLWIGGGGALVLGAMIAWQFHPEIARLFAKIVSKVKR